MFSCSRFLVSSVVLSAAFVLHGEETLAHLQPTADTYLESDGAGGGINTGYYVTPKTRIEADYRVLSTSGTRYLYGCLWDQNASTIQYGHYCQLNSGKYYQKMSYYNGTKMVWALSKEAVGEGAARYQSTFDLKNRQLSVRMQGVGVESADIPAEAVLPTSGTPLALFGSMAADGQAFQSGNRSSIRLYSLAIYDDDVLVRDFIPYGAGAVTGLLDRCTGKVYRPTTKPTPNAPFATGNFKLGADDGCVMSSLKSPADQGLDTGIVATPNTKIEVDFTLLNPTGGDSVFGVDSQDGGLQFDFRLNKNKNFCWNFQDEQQTLTSMSVVATPADRRIVFDGPGDTITMTRGTTVEYTASISASLPAGATRTQTSGGTIQLFNRALYSAEGDVSCTGHASMQIRSAKIWENGTLVRDFAPRMVDNVVGLYDSVSGKLFSNAPSAITRFDGGGAIACTSENGVGIAANADAYISGYGAYIKTDYYPNGKTRIEADYQILMTNGTRRLFGCESSSGLMSFGLYFQKSLQMFHLNNSKTGKARYFNDRAPLGDDRYWSYVDLYVGKIGTYSGGELVGEDDAMSAYVSHDDVSAQPLGIHCYTKADGSAGQWGDARIYGLKVYEAGALVRNYIPAYKDGEGGLWEACNQKFWGSSNADVKFAFHGAGTNGCGMVFSEQPKSCTLKLDGEDTLVAFAPTAIAYQWYENGEPIAGATKSSLKVTWKRPRVNTYKCVAFYAQFGQAESDEAVVTGEPSGLKIIFR